MGLPFFLMILVILVLGFCPVIVAHADAPPLCVAPGVEHRSEGAVESRQWPEPVEDFAVDLPRIPDDAALNVLDFGADPGLPDNLPAFARAIAACREKAPVRLVIPNGVYRFETTETLVFEDLRDFELDGGGSTFLFYHPNERNALISVLDCERVRFRDFTVDWDWEKAPLASLVRVDKVDPDGKYFDLRHVNPHPVRKKIAASINPIDPATMTVGTPEAEEFGMWIIREQEWVERDLLRLWYRDEMPNAMPPRHLGRLYSARHYTYDIHAVLYARLSHATFERVRIHGAPGDGFVGALDCDHLHFLNCAVTRPPGSDRLISVTADHCMIMNARGFVKIEGCEFGHGGDDGINIHPRNHRGVVKTGPRTLSAAPVFEWTTPFAQGDTVELRRGDLSPLGYVSRLTAVVWDPPNRACELTFEDDLPGIVPEDAFLFDLRWATSSYIIRNCRFHNNRARGVLAQSPNGLIENCVFEHTQGPAIQVECGFEERWSEGYGVSNLVIRNNTFVNCNANAWLPAANRPVIYMSVYLAEGRTAHPVFRDVTIADNSFSGQPGAAVFATSVQGLRVTDNTLHAPAPFAATVPLSGAVYAALARDVLVTGNAWSADAAWQAPGVALESDTTRGVVVSGNRFVP